MDGLDEVRLREVQQIVVLLQVFRMVGKLVAAIIRLTQLVSLDHGAHRAVDDGQALRQQVFELCDAVEDFGQESGFLLNRSIDAAQVHPGARSASLIKIPREP